MHRKIYVHDISDYTRDPNNFFKNDYNPFGHESMTWLTWYFVHKTVRNKIRIYASYGRTEREAATGLRKSLKKPRLALKTISKKRYQELKRKRK